MKTERLKVFPPFLAIILCLIPIFGASGCSSEDKASNAPDTLRYDSISLSQQCEGSGIICENENWRLDWDSERKRVSFAEKATGIVWSPMPTEAMELVEDSDGMLLKNHPQVESDLLVYYYDPNTLDEKVALSANDAEENGGIYTQRLKNGLRLIYDFAELEIVVPVDYTIEEDRFLITIQPSWIADNGENIVTAVALAPFLCGLQNSREDGSWLFLPDGSGTLIAPCEIDIVGSTGMAGVYGEDFAVQNYNFTSVTQQMYLPVYGVKKGDSALLAVIDSGAEGTALAWNIGAQNIRYSTVYPFFRIRGYSLVEAPRGFNSPLTEIKVFADQISTVPLRVAGYSLSGKQADIAGMAQTYQDYLIKHKGLAEKSQSQKIVSFRYVGALVQPSFFLGMPTTKLYSLTTTEDAIQMTKELVDELGADFDLNLTGFGNSGVDPGAFAGGYTVAGSLGGEQGMRELAEELDTLGLDWYMDFNLVSFNKSSDGFSRNNDIAVLPNGQAAWFSSYNTVTRKQNPDRFFLLSRNQLSNAAERLVEKAADMQLSGISLSSLSHIVYSDYASNETGVSAGMAIDAETAFQIVRQGGYKLQAVAANDYAAVNADTITGVPLYSSGYDVSFADVPFYSMVFKGFVPMSSVAVNLCADMEDALLRCVESGIAPSYTLMFHYDNTLITNRHSFVFGSDFYGNKQRIIDSVNQLKEYLESVKDASVAEYLMDEEVRVTIFDNGVYAAVNYGEGEAYTAYGYVPPHGFITGRRSLEN